MMPGVSGSYKFSKLKLNCILGTLAGLSLSINLFAETAQVRLICRSLRFTPDDHGSNESLAFTVADTLEGVDNGELGPRSFSETNTLSGFYRLLTPAETHKRIDDAILALPPFRDVNGNGIPDFYESSLPVESFTTSGVFEDPRQNKGGISLTWSRPANSPTGACDIQFISSATLSIFSLPFTLLEYSGSLDYTNRNGTVTGTVDLRSGTRRLRGPVSFQALDADHLQGDVGAWAIDSREMPWTSEGLFQRFGANYVANITFPDGEPDTALADYRIWMLLITDSNDTDGNGIPNLTGALKAVAPRLSIQLSGGSSLFLSVQGTLNRLHEIQSSDQPGQPAWRTIQSFVLTNNPQVVALPFPTPAQGFFRVRVP